MLLRKGAKAVLEKRPNDVVFLAALRTPITKAYKGGLHKTHPEQLLAAVLKGIRNHVPDLDASVVQDVAVGTVLSELGGSKLARMALNHVGFPTSTSVYTVNRACASSLQAVAGVADSITVGRINAGIGGGMESMTQNYASKAIPTVVWSELLKSPVQSAKDCLMPMGLTSENVAKRYGISRQDQDAFALSSHTKATKAQISGFFDEEIVPVSVRDADGQESLVTEDDGIRRAISLEKLSLLKPAFAETGSSTAGNSSQISDGASGALMMRRSHAEALSLGKYIIGKWGGSAVIGVDPDEMGIGPALVVPTLLDSVGLSTKDIGIWELNEAFASQTLYCVRTLGLDVDKVNPNGGAIALGHPLGATGGRQLATLLSEMKRRGEETGVISMCVGTGMGMSALVIAE